jgi:hypothetical protein
MLKLIRFSLAAAALSGAWLLTTLAARDFTVFYYTDIRFFAFSPVHAFMLVVFAFALGVAFGGKR